MSAKSVRQVSFGLPLGDELVAASLSPRGATKDIPSNSRSNVRRVELELHIVHAVPVAGARRTACGVVTQYEGQQRVRACCPAAPGRCGCAGTIAVTVVPTPGSDVDRQRRRHSVRPRRRDSGSPRPT